MYRNLDCDPVTEVPVVDRLELQCDDTEFLKLLVSTGSQSRPDNELTWILYSSIGESESSAGSRLSGSLGTKSRPRCLFPKSKCCVIFRRTSRIWSGDSLSDSNWCRSSISVYIMLPIWLNNSVSRRTNRSFCHMECHSLMVWIISKAMIGWEGMDDDDDAWWIIIRCGSTSSWSTGWSIWLYVSLCVSLTGDRLLITMQVMQFLIPFISHSSLYKTLTLDSMYSRTRVALSNRPSDVSYDWIVWNLYSCTCSVDMFLDQQIHSFSTLTADFKYTDSRDRSNSLATFKATCLALESPKRSCDWRTCQIMSDYVKHRSWKGYVACQNQQIGRPETITWHTWSQTFLCCPLNFSDRSLNIRSRDTSEFDWRIALESVVGAPFEW